MLHPVRYPLHDHPHGWKSLRGTVVDGQVWFLLRDINRALFGPGNDSFSHLAGDENLTSLPVDQLGLVDTTTSRARLVNLAGIKLLIGPSTIPRTEKLKIAIAEATDAILASQPPPAPEPEKTRQRPALGRTVTIGPCRVYSADGTYLGTTTGDTTATFEPEPEQEPEPWKTATKTVPCSS